MYWELPRNRLNVYSKNVNLLKPIATSTFSLCSYISRARQRFLTKGRRRGCVTISTQERSNMFPTRLFQPTRAEPGQHPRGRGTGGWPNARGTRSRHRAGAWFWLTVLTACFTSIKLTPKRAALEIRDSIRSTEAVTWLCTRATEQSIYDFINLGRKTYRNNLSHYTFHNVFPSTHLT